MPLWPTHRSLADGMTTNEHSLPFLPQSDYYHICTENGQKIDCSIHSEVEKGFFYSDSNWTCYRRNYFKVNCFYTFDPFPSNAAIYLRKDKMYRIMSIAMTLSANEESPNGKFVELVQHTPKRNTKPKHHPVEMQKILPNTKDMQLSFDTRNPCLPCHFLDADNKPLVVPDISIAHTFERVQFKSATANNGKRRAQQHHYCLNVELWADIRESTTNEANWVKIGMRSSAQVVVRGRSPSHFQQDSNTLSRFSPALYGAAVVPSPSTASSLTSGALTRTPENTKLHCPRVLEHLDTFGSNQTPESSLKCRGLRPRDHMVGADASQDKQPLTNCKHSRWTEQCHPHESPKVHPLRSSFTNGNEANAQAGLWTSIRDNFSIELLEDTLDGNQTTPRRFACPYFKHKPAKYSTERACLGPGWTSVHRVK